MNTMTLLLGAGLIGALAFAVGGKKKDGGYTDEEKGGKPLDVPDLTPPAVLSVGFGSVEETTPSVFILKEFRKDLLPAIFADFTFLYTPEVQADYLNLAGAMAMAGSKDAVAYAQQRIADYSAPAYYRTLEFDSNLDKATRAMIFWYWLANEWEILKNALNDDALAKFPKFRNSVYKALQATVYGGAPPPWEKKNYGGGVDSQGKIDAGITDKIEQGQPQTAVDTTGTEGPPYYVQGPTGQRFDMPPDPASAGEGNEWVWDTTVGVWEARKMAGPAGGGMNVSNPDDEVQSGDSGQENIDPQTVADKIKEFFTL